MAQIRPFKCVRPKVELANRIAALPYDVYSREEAKKEVIKEPLSFLKIDRAETQFSDEVDTYDERVYLKARDSLIDMVEKGELIKDNQAYYYIYELTMGLRSQTGIVACASIDDYINHTIRKHENTRADKEADRIHHVDVCNAQTGPIFLAYRANEKIDSLISSIKKRPPLYDFTSTDGIRHTVWKSENEMNNREIYNEFSGMNHIYIADGHHRCASAVKVGLKRREEKPDYLEADEFNYFLSVLFPDNQLMIMDYNRVVRDLNGYTTSEFLSAIEKIFDVSKPQNEPYKPMQKGEVGMYLDQNWYALRIREAYKNSDPVNGLDVSILQNYLLKPILNIADPKTDNRIDFVGGIRGLKELEKRVTGDCKVAFAMYPTSISELFDVADAGLLMPPKSTWFEPKLRSGLFIHELN